VRRGRERGGERGGEGREEEEEEEGSLRQTTTTRRRKVIQANAVNEEDPERDRATLAYPVESVDRRTTTRRKEVYTKQTQEEHIRIE
jgi:hypothetical protein